MQKYKINFTEYQKNILATVEFNGDKRNKVMSILSYIVKHSVAGTLIKSINKLYKMYIRYHKNVSNKYFYTLVNELIELGLLSKENNNIVVVQEKVQKKVQIEKPVETTENTSIEIGSDLPKDKGLNNNTIYSNTDAVAPVELICKAEELLKDLNIKSKIVKKMVIDKLKTCYNVNRAGFISYITKVIAEKKAIQENRRMTYMTNKSNYNAFNDYNQRQYTNAEYSSIEKQLLGW